MWTSYLLTGACMKFGLLGVLGLVLLFSATAQQPSKPETPPTFARPAQTPQATPQTKASPQSTPFVTPPLSGPSPAPTVSSTPLPSSLMSTGSPTQSANPLT